MRFHRFVDQLFQKASTIVPFHVVGKYFEPLVLFGEKPFTKTFRRVDAPKDGFAKVAVTTGLVLVLVLLLTLLTPATTLVTVRCGVQVFLQTLQTHQTVCTTTKLDL